MANASLAMTIVRHVKGLRKTVLVVMMGCIGIRRNASKNARLLRDISMSLMRKVNVLFQASIANSAMKSVKRVTFVSSYFLYALLR